MLSIVFWCIDNIKYILFEVKMNEVFIEVHLCSIYYIFRSTIFHRKFNSIQYIRSSFKIFFVQEKFVQFSSISVTNISTRCFRVNDIDNAMWNRCQKQVTVVARTHACLPDQSNCLDAASSRIAKNVVHRARWICQNVVLISGSKKLSTEGGLVENVFNIGTVTFECATKSGACKQVDKIRVVLLFQSPCIKLY